MISLESRPDLPTTPDLGRMAKAQEIAQLHPTLRLLRHQRRASAPSTAPPRARSASCWPTKGIELVYGGASVGIMGELADAVHEGGGHVTGIIPQQLMKKEAAHTGIPDLIVVASMHQRKSQMADLSDGFIALPGGIGTLEGFFEILTWGQLGIHAKPCGILNVAGYFDALTEFLDHAVKEGFLTRSTAR